MAITVASVQTFTDAELLILYRNAMASFAAGGQEYEIGNRRLNRGDIQNIRETIEWLETRVQADGAAESGGMNAIVYFPGKS